MREHIFMLCIIITTRNEQTFSAPSFQMHLSGNLVVMSCYSRHRADDDVEGVLH